MPALADMTSPVATLGSKFHFHGNKAWQFIRQPASRNHFIVQNNLQQNKFV